MPSADLCAQRSGLGRRAIRHTSGRSRSSTPERLSGRLRSATGNGVHMATERIHVRTDNSAYPPIADYGFLSDCEVTALVAPSGNIEWLCLPRFDGPSVFESNLDRDAGGFRLGPADV